MIEIVYCRSRERITIRGHAGAGEYGSDPVCAGCSALAHTLAENLRRLERRGHVQELLIRLEPGDGEICYRARCGAKSLVRGKVEAVMAGFEVLARNSPEFVRYELHG